MIHDEMCELQEYLTPPPTPLFKREVPLIEDKETRKKHQDEFAESVIKVCEKLHIKDAFVFIATLAIIEKMESMKEKRLNPISNLSFPS